MAQGYKDWASGNTLTAADLEDYTVLQSVMRFASAAARDTALASVLTEGLLAFLLDSNTLTMYSGTAWSTIGPLHGAGITWTPTVTQSGSVTVTNTYSVYWRVGRRVKCITKLTVTGSGTGANAVVIGALPFTAAIADIYVGTGSVSDATGPAQYQGNAYLSSTTTLTLWAMNTTAADTRLGLNQFTAALASGDIVFAQFEYEAAADA